MLGEVIKGILGILWAIVRAIILEAIVSFLWSAILATIVYPIGALGQMAHAVLGSREGIYNAVDVDSVRRRALLGVLVLLVLWSGAYFLFGPDALLIIGGVTLLIAILGWFDKVVVRDID